MHCFLRYPPPPPFFFPIWKICKDCTARVAWQLHQAVCVNSLCVDDVVDLEMLGLSCKLQSVAFHTMLSSLASSGNTLHISNRDDNNDDDCGFTCTVAKSQKWSHPTSFFLLELRISVKHDATPRPGVWRTAVEAELFRLPTADSRQVKICNSQESRGQSLTQSLTLSLPDWTQKFKKKKWIKKPDIVHQQSCQHLYCMTILRERFWCFVTLQTLSCVCVTSVPRPPPTTPHPRSHPPDQGTRGKSHTQPWSSCFYSTWLPVQDALFNLWSNLFEEWLLWRLCLILLLIFVFLMLCLYAALH